MTARGRPGRQWPVAVLREVLRRRGEGETFAEIGDAVGCGHCVARALYLRALRYVAATPYADPNFEIRHGRWSGAAA